MENTKLPAVRGSYPPGAIKLPNCSILPFSGERLQIWQGASANHAYPIFDRYTTQEGNPLSEFLFAMVGQGECEVSLSNGFQIDWAITRREISDQKFYFGKAGIWQGQVALWEYDDFTEGIRGPWVSPGECQTALYRQIAGGLLCCERR